ncbi:hypothetical protein N599_29395 [Saccharopolyspora erythraea D]|nr:hypothetical protein N599_29395 [Saccharopolyspora erythraea D]
MAADGAAGATADAGGIAATERDETTERPQDVQDTLYKTITRQDTEYTEATEYTATDYTAATRETEPTELSDTEDAGDNGSEPVDDDGASRQAAGERNGVGSSRPRLPDYFLSGDSLGRSPQLSETVGADRVVASAERLLPKDSSRDGIDKLEQAVRKQFGSLFKHGRKFKVGDVTLLVKADFTADPRTLVQPARGTQSASTSSDYIAGASTQSAHRPDFTLFWFIPGVPGVFGTGVINIPLGASDVRGTSRTDTHSQSMSLTLPAQAGPDSDSEYTGTRALWAPLKFEISRVDDDGRVLGDSEFVGGKDDPDSRPVGVALGVATGLRPLESARPLPMPRELPPSVVEAPLVDESARGYYKGKPVGVKTKDGQAPTIYEQVAAQIPSLSEKGKETLENFIAGIGELLPPIAVTQEQADAGLGWQSSEALLPSGNPLKRLLRSRAMRVQARAVVRKVAYLETIDNAPFASSTKDASQLTSQHGAGREVSASQLVGAGVDALGILAAGGGPYFGAGLGSSQEKQFASTTEHGEAAARDVKLLRYRKVLDLEVRLPGRPAITFPGAIDSANWTPAEFAQNAGMLDTDGRPEVDLATDITRTGLRSSGAGAKLAEIFRESARTIPGHHRWSFWRDTALVTDFGDPKLKRGIKGRTDEQLKRGDQIDAATSGARLSSPQVVEEMLTDQATVVELVEQGRGHDYHVSLKLDAKVLEVKAPEPVDEVAATTTTTESESALHSTGRSWTAAGGFAGRVYSVVAGAPALITSYHKFGFTRSKASAIGEKTERTFGGARGKEPAASGSVGPEPRKRLAFRVRYTASGTHWQEWNALVKGVTIGRPGVHTTEVKNLPIVDSTAAAEGREPGVVEVDQVIELPASKADQLHAELLELMNSAVEPVDRHEVPDDDETTSHGFSRLYDGTELMSLHGLRHIRESAYRQLEKLSGHGNWKLADNGRLVNSGISLGAIRRNPRSWSKKIRLGGLVSERRRRGQVGAVEYSLMRRNPRVLLDDKGNPLEDWKRPAHSMTGGRTTDSSTTGAGTFVNSIEPGIIPASDFSGEHDGSTFKLGALALLELTPWKGSFFSKRGYTTTSSRTRSEKHTAVKGKWIEADVEVTVAAEIKTSSNLPLRKLFKSKPDERSAERFTLPRAGKFWVTDEELHEIRTKQAEVDAQRAREAAENPPAPSPAAQPAPSTDLAPLPPGQTLATPSWSGGVTAAVDLTERTDRTDRDPISKLHERLVNHLGSKLADQVLPRSAQDTGHPNYPDVAGFLSNVQAKLGDVENGGASTTLRIEDRRRKGHTYELHVDAELLSEPVAQGITHGELVTANDATVTLSETRQRSRVLLEVFSALIPTLDIAGPDSSVPSPTGEPTQQHGGAYAKLGLGLVHIAEWLKQSRTRARSEAKHYTQTETVSGALAAHRADVLFDLRIERHGETLASVQEPRNNVGIRTAVEDALPADVAQRPRGGVFVDREASEATGEALRRWREAEGSERLPDDSRFRAVDFLGKVDDLVEAVEHYVTQAGGSVDAETRRKLRAWFTPHRLEALLGPLAARGTHAVEVELPDWLGVDVAIAVRLDRGTLTSTSGRINLGGQPTTSETEQDAVSSGNGHAVFAAPFVAGGVSQPEGAETYEEGRNPFGSVGDWNIPLRSLGAHESELEQEAEEHATGASGRGTSTDYSLKDITSTWSHRAEFRIIASGKRTAVGDVPFEAGYVIRRGDRGDELPAELVAATRQFAESDREWTAATYQEHAAHFHLSRAEADEAKAKREADELAQHEAEARRQADEWGRRESVAWTQAAGPEWHGDAVGREAAEGVWRDAAVGKEAAEEVRREAEAANRAAQQRWQEAVASKQAAEQLWNEAARRKQVAEQTWWQAKQYYEFQLAKARTESDLAGGPADVSVTFPDDADTLPLSKLVELNGVTRKALDHAVETGRPARIRYVVHGDLRAVDEAHQSRAKRDFSEAMGQLRRSLNLVQAGMGTPNHARLGPEAVGLYATPQFLHSEGPTRVQIWVEQDAAVHEDGSGGHEPADARGQEPVESASGWSREDLRREAQQARSSLDDADAAERQRLRRGAAAVLARHHDFTGQTNGRAEHDLAALREDMEAVVAQRLSESGETRARELSRGLAEWFQTWRGVRAGAGPEPADGGMPPEGGETGLKRARGGRTLRGVARAIGVTHSTLSRWEKGRGDIDPHYRERLAAFYGVSQEELFADIPEASGETRLKRERARVGRTQREVAEKIGVHLSTLSNWEHGRDNIAPRHRERLAAFLWGFSGGAFC